MCIKNFREMLWMLLEGFFFFLKALQQVKATQSKSFGEVLINTGEFGQRPKYLAWIQDSE